LTVQSIEQMPGEQFARLQVLPLWKLTWKSLELDVTWEDWAADRGGVQKRVVLTEADRDSRDIKSTRLDRVCIVSFED
jgi:hypothetical protein